MGHTAIAEIQFGENGGPPDIHRVWGFAQSSPSAPSSSPPQGRVSFPPSLLLAFHKVLLLTFPIMQHASILPTTSSPSPLPPPLLCSRLHLPCI